MKKLIKMLKKHFEISCFSEVERRKELKKNEDAKNVVNVIYSQYNKILQYKKSSKLKYCGNGFHLWVHEYFDFSYYEVS